MVKSQSSKSATNEPGQAMKKRKNKRWRLVVDVKIQLLLCARIVVYWMVCQITMIAAILGYAVLLDGSTSDSTGSLWRLLIPALTVSSLMLPIMLFDMVAFSNRFVGPIFNFRRKFKQFVEQGSADEMTFRNKDFFPDLCDNFNKLRNQSTCTVSSHSRNTVQQHDLAEECRESVAVN